MGGGRSGALAGLAGLDRLLAKSGPPPVLLFLGEDRRELDEALTRLGQVTVEAGAEAFDETRLRGGESTAEEVVEACSTLPVVGGRRLVVVRESDRLKGQVTLLSAYLADPAPTTCLVLVPGAFDRRLKASKEIESAAVVVRFAAPEGQELDAWVRRRLEGQGLTIASDALALLEDMVEADTLLLGQELEKLALYCSRTGKVERADVEAVLGRTRTIDIWELTNAVEDGRADEAVGALRRLLGQGAGVPMLVGMLDWCLGRLLASEKPKAPPGRRRALQERRRALRGRGAEIYRELRAADRLFRTTGGDAEAALERAVLTACRLGGD